MNPLTVKQLHKTLEDLIKQGKGDRLVLIPDYDIEFPFDYRTIDLVDADDMTETCIYLEIANDDDEIAFWKDRETK